MDLEIKLAILSLMLHHSAKWIVIGLNKIIYLSIVIGTVFAQYQNIAVVENDAMEQTLPDYLRNPFYRTPRIREALAYSSWLGPGEHLVLDRNSEKIPRWEIYSVLTHAGLIERRRNFS